MAARQTSVTLLASWHPTGHRSLLGDLPTGDLIAQGGKLIACTITLESARRLYPEYLIEETEV